MGLQKPHHQKSLTLDVHAEPWFVFIDTFNVIFMMLPDRWDSWATLDLYIDASNIGFGGYFNDRYLAGVWPVNRQNKCIVAALIDITPQLLRIAALVRM
ncbi:hypothetical protein MAR_006868, partial [Mya arenaria]